MPSKPSLCTAKSHPAQVFQLSDFSYGAGLNYNISPSTDIGIDYINYFKKDGAKIDGLTIGVGFRF